MQAGRMKYRVRFERRTTTDDGFGNVVGAWSDLITVWASFRPRFGRESVEAGRLESTTTGTLTIRRSSASSAITAADRVVFVTGEWEGKILNIRSIVPTPAGVEMVLEEGVAT
jgi:SPP1 family predicted phage head-tail adaptor